MNKAARSSILWIYDDDDMNKLSSWLAHRGFVSAIMEIAHEDTGAVSLCFFDGDQEAGIIRCADRRLAEIVTEYLAERALQVVANF